MEGTHCTLQLQAPITELCFISFYLPRGEVRGFSYKGTVTLDKSNKGFHSCYQVREGLDIISLNLQPKEHPGDIFFKQTPTKDILAELYKLTAERQRLLASLLSSDHILGIAMGNQEGKLPELSVSLAPPEDDSFRRAGNWQGEPPVGCVNKKKAHGNKKLRRFGGRKENTEEPPKQKKTRRKGQQSQEPAAQPGKEQIFSSSSLPLSSTRQDLRFLEERGNLVTTGVLSSSPLRRESCTPEAPRMLDSTPGLWDSWMVSEEASLGRPGLASDCSYADPGEGGAGEWQRAPCQQAGSCTRHKDQGKQRSQAEKGGPERGTQRSCRKKPVSKVVVKVQDRPTQVQRAVKAHPEDEGILAFCQADQSEFIPRADLLTLPGTETGTQLPGPAKKDQQRDGSLQLKARGRAPAGTEGAVNKVLQKVIESEKLDEATEGKRLGFSAKNLPLPDSRSKRGAGLPCVGHTALLSDQPSSMGPESSQIGSDEARLSYPPALAAVSVALNNSSSQFGTHKHMPPVPWPLTAGLPSPPQHRRILQLPPPLGEGEASLDDFPSLKGSVVFGSQSADTLEPPSSTRVTETEGANLTCLRARHVGLVPGEPLGPNLGTGENTAPPQHQSLPG